MAAICKDLPLTVPIIPGFVGGVLDRADHVRMATALPASAFADPRARMLVLDGLDPVEGGDGELPWASLPPGRPATDFILLGVDEVGPAFAEINPDIPPAAVFAPTGGELASLLRPAELHLYGCAR